MAKNIVSLREFEGSAGFNFRKDIRGYLIDVILPRDYTLISKVIQFGLLKKIEFRDAYGHHHSYEN